MASGLLVLGASSCVGLPEIDGEPVLPPITVENPMPNYRNLADIPNRPPVTPEESRRQATQSLRADQAAAAQAAASLRREPVAIPAPAPPVPGS